MGLAVFDDLKQPLVCILIDDDPSQRQLIRIALESVYTPLELEYAEYDRAEHALADLPVDRNSVILCDYNLGSSSGIDWLPDFVRADVGPIILMTSLGNEDIATEAFRSGASDFIEKEEIFESPKRLRSIIKEARRKYKYLQANKDLSKKLKIANHELEQKNKTLAQLTDTAHRFVDDVAHEFRTPLAVIKEFASILSDEIGGPVTEKQAEFLGYISDASADLASLIDDFLDSSKLRSRSLPVKRTEHNVKTIIDSVWPLLTNRAGAKSINLERCIPDSIPMVYADADKVSRSIINLVINAIKFSNPNDTVTVSASLNNDGMIELSISDQGPGLPKDAAEQLFNRFKQLDSTSNMDTKGFGLGLSIVREMVRINLGQVRVESELGKGSTFTFTLPQADKTCILRAMIDSVKARSPFGTLCTLKTPKMKPEQMQRAFEFLSSSCYPTDLVLRSEFQPGVIYILGETIEPGRWIARLKDIELPCTRCSAFESIDGFDLEAMGMWPLNEAMTGLSAHMLAHKEIARRA